MNLQKQLDTQARRLARKLDWRVEKSKTRKNFHSNDNGGYMIINGNHCLYGVAYELSVEDVIDILKTNITNQ